MKKAYLTLISAVVSVMLMAQEEKGANIDVDINKGDSADWYASPWVWVVGAAVFIILLVALTSGGRRSRSAGSTDKVTVTKTVKRDTDV